MISSYKKFDSSEYEGVCLWCRDSIKGTDAVAHEGRGESHPLHRGCLIKLDPAFIKKCLYCQASTDTASLLTWEEKMAIEWKCLKNDMRAGVVPGLIHAIFMGVMVGGIAMSIGLNAMVEKQELIAVNQEIIWAGGLATLVIGGLETLVIGRLRLEQLRRVVGARELVAALVGQVGGGIVAVEAVVAAIRIMAEQGAFRANGTILVTNIIVEAVIAEQRSVVEGIGIVGMITGASAVASAICGFFQRRLT